MRLISRILLISLSMVTAGFSQETVESILARIKAPEFKKQDFPITDFGAKPDADATEAISKAIEACNSAGGGRVVIPKGTFLTGAVHLKSNVNLHVSEGATLKFDTDPAKYPIVYTRWEGVDLMGYSPLIYAYRQKNIAVTGQGVIDGQASDRYWWSWKGPGWRGSVDHGWREGMPHQREARTRLFQMAEDGVPVEKRVFADGAYLRPPMISPYGCENVLIEGVRLIRSPFWHIHPVLCTNVIVRSVEMRSHGPNTDGCNPESTRQMLIDRCLFDTGDDCIAVDSGRNNEGRRIGVEAEDIVIQDCTMIEGHGALVIGSVISGGARNIFAQRCQIGSPHLMYAIRFKNNAMRGGLLENFFYRDIDVKEVSHAALQCDFNYEEGPNGPYHPTLRHVSIEGLKVRNAPMVADLQGLANAPIANVHIRASRFEGVTRKSIVTHIEDLVLADVEVNGRQVTTL
ncbi:MAG: glycoside hydrolase family 28 protein [Luteolibacter sp.]